MNRASERASGQNGHCTIDPLICNGCLQCGGYGIAARLRPLLARIVGKIVAEGLEFVALREHSSKQSPIQLPTLCFHIKLYQGVYIS